MKKTIEFKFDERDGAPCSDQLAMALNREWGGSWEVDYQLATVRGLFRGDNPDAPVEYSLVPEAEFIRHVRERAAENNNPEPSAAEVERDIHENYHEAYIDGQRYVLVEVE